MKPNEKKCHSLDVKRLLCVLYKNCFTSDYEWFCQNVGAPLICAAIFHIFFSGNGSTIRPVIFSDDGC